MKTAILAVAAIAMVGCGTMQTVTPESEPKRVTVQLMGSGDWWASVAVFGPDNASSRIKQSSDTSALDLGEMEIGDRFTMRTGVGRVEYFRQPDSVRIIMGRDTLIKYGPEALEAVYIVK